MKRMARLTLSAFVLQLATANAIACSVSVTSLQFISINLQTGSDSTATVTVDCTDTPSVSFSVTLTAGSSGTFAQRTMSSGAHTLNYNLYLDSSRTQIWGDGKTGGTVPWNGATATSAQHTVFGRVPSQPTAFPGSYTDNITVTVTY